MLYDAYMLATGLTHVSPGLQDPGWKKQLLLGNVMLLGEGKLSVYLALCPCSSHFISR